MTVYREAPRNLQGSSFKKGGYWFGEYKIHTQKLTGSLYTENVNYLEARMEMITPFTIAMTEKKNRKEFRKTYVGIKTNGKNTKFLNSKVQNLNSINCPQIILQI